MAEDLLELTHIPTGASPLSIATNRLSQLLRAQLTDLLKQNGNIGLPIWRIYTGLAEMNEATQKQLATFTRIEQSHISRALAQLEDRGELLSRRCDEDKRARRFCFTPTGRENYERLLPIVELFYQNIDGAFSPEEIALYLELTERLAQAALSSASAAEQTSKLTA